MDSYDRRFNDLLTDVFDGLRDCYPDVINDEDNREPLIDAARAVYDSRTVAGVRASSDYEALRDAVEAAIDQFDAAPAL
ncbi:hypothetical protein [Rhizobium leguminosarum]|uniref:hypothetical protein n=1 Tax=Rhizobium leguminosarum TaxID=384 RepID=UPI002E103F5B|nr:hypothetical protein U8Q02_43670 [Rhizobium leguminosarum]